MEQRICTSCGKSHDKRRGGLCNSCHHRTRARVPCAQCGAASGRIAGDDRHTKAPICQPCRRLTAAARKAESASRLRALRRGAFVARVWREKVFELDGYRCHLCNRKCKKVTTYLKNSRVPHPLSPTIDHLTPLAKGGTHEPSNCRTACFRCNSRKSDGGGGDQFALAV